VDVFRHDAVLVIGSDNNRGRESVVSPESVRYWRLETKEAPRIRWPERRPYSICSATTRTVATRQDVSVRDRCSMAHTKSPEHMLKRQLTSHKVVACQISRLSDLSLLSVVAHNSADEFRGPRHPCDGDDNPFAEPWACEIQQSLSSGSAFVCAP
jgi:hypothetical protein